MSHVVQYLATPKNTREELLSRGPKGSPTNPLIITIYIIGGLVALLPVLVIGITVIILQLIIKCWSNNSTEIITNTIVDHTASNKATLSLPKDNTTFTVMTYNIAGLSPHINVNQPNRRLQEYCNRLLSTPSSLLPTVICFQESFHPYVSQVIINKTLSSIYPFMVLSPIPQKYAVPGFEAALEMDSGLLVCSRLPLTFAVSRPYGVSVGADNQANKGCCLVGVTTGRKEGEEIIVATSHIQSDETNDPLWWGVAGDRGKKARKVKECQFGIMAEFIKDTLERRRKEGCTIVGVIACGDFNVPGEILTLLKNGSSSPPSPSNSTMVTVSENGEHKDMMERLNKHGIWKDAYRVIHPVIMGEVYNVDKVGITIDGERNIDCNPLELSRLDYVLYKGDIEPKAGRVLHNEWTELWEEDFDGDGKLKEGRNTMVEGRPERRGKCFSDHNGVVVDFRIL